MSVPIGYSGAAAIAMVQLRTSEKTYPVASDILTLLNAGVEQVQAEVGSVRLQSSIATTVGQNTLTFANDVQDIISMSYSTALPTSPGVIVYPMQQLEQASFMDFAAGVPATGYGPPTAWMIVSDTAASNTSGDQITVQLYPPAQSGYINVYYRGRPQLWADTSATSFTNLDTMAQEAVVLWTCARVLESRGRGDEAKDLFTPQYETTIGKLKDQIARRSAPKSGVVRDVRALTYPGGGSPWWF